MKVCSPPISAAPNRNGTAAETPGTAAISGAIAAENGAWTAFETT